MSTRKYECLYILPPTKTTEEVDQVAAHFKEVVEKNGGTVSEAGLWQKRPLAYEVAGFNEGNYVLMLFESPGSVPQELSRLLRISDDVIRHRIFAKDDDEAPAEEAEA